MSHQPGASQSHQRKIERAIVFQLLREDDDHERWPEAELATTLNEQASWIAAAVERLQDSGVLLVESGGALAAPCAHYLDGLGVIGI